MYKAHNKLSLITNKGRNQNMNNEARPNIPVPIHISEALQQWKEAFDLVETTFTVELKTEFKHTPLDNQLFRNHSKGSCRR